MDEYNKKTSNDTIAARSALLDFYSDRCVAFGGFFIASIFGLLTVLSLAQGINCGDASLQFQLIVLSWVAYGFFGYIGFYVLRNFSYYANFANILEGGTGDPEALRSYAKLNDITYWKQEKDKPKEKIGFSDYMTEISAKRNNSLHRRLLKNKKFLFFSFVTLYFILAVITYIPLIEGCLSA